MKSPTTRRQAVEEIAFLNEMIEGAQIFEKMLLDYLDEICTMIYLQAPPVEIDRFVERMIELGFYEPDTDIDPDVIGLA